MKIERGISRTVLLIGSWAVKVPTTRPYGRRGDRLWAWTRGYQANHSELQWAGIDGVAPVLWHWGNVVVCFRRAQPLTDTDVPYQDDPWWGTIAPALMFGDRKASNVGLIDGRPVWLDYDGSWNGCPHARAAHDTTDQEDRE